MRAAWQWGLLAVASVAIVIVLWEFSQHNYLLYHSLAELATIGVAAAIFAIGWNTRGFARSTLLLVLAVGYLSAGFIDILHTLAYRGMGVFPGVGANLPTQFWIAARGVESITLLLAANLLVTRLTVRPLWLGLAYLLATTLLVLAITPWGIFPDCYNEAAGRLTPFKIDSEYVIIFLLATAGVLFWHGRRLLDRRVLLFLIVAVAAKVLSEYSFTLYDDVYGTFNFIGHIFKLASTVAIYFALVQGSLMTPYQTIFRELVHSQDELRKQLDERQHIEQEREILTHTISHDLRAPLTIVQGHGQLLEGMLGEEEIDREMARHGVEAILRGARRMNVMIQDLVDVARLEGGKLELNLRPVSLADFTADLLTRAQQGVIDRARIHTDISPDLPPVLADPDRLERILLNLLTNAQKYSPADAPVDVRARQEGQAVLIAVRDQGQGIDPEDLPHIFERFYRPRRGRKAEGVGLGLYITRMLVEAHGGRIQVESTPDQGSTFSFTLPLAWHPEIKLIDKKDER